VKKSKSRSVVIYLICAVLALGNSNCTKEEGRNIGDNPDSGVKSVLNMVPPGQYVQGSEQTC